MYINIFLPPPVGMKILHIHSLVEKVDQKLEFPMSKKGWYAFMLFLAITVFFFGYAMIVVTQRCTEVHAQKNSNQDNHYHLPRRRELLTYKKINNK